MSKKRPPVCPCPECGGLGVVTGEEVIILKMTQPESLLRVCGKGLLKFGDKGRGDLYLRIRITIPERTDSEE